MDSGNGPAVAENPSTPEPAPEPDPAPEPEPEPDPAPDGGLTLDLDVASLTVGEGTTTSLPVRLSAQPDGEIVVTVTLVETDGSIELVGPQSLTFTPTTWDQSQVIDFRSPDDANATDGVALAELTADGLPVVRVTIISSDDEAPQGGGVALTVKDSSGYGVANHPLMAVIPLKAGKFQTTDRFRIKDADGNAIPAQFVVLNRYWANDNSIRHVVAHFRATAGPDGEAAYFFDVDGGADPAPENPVSVTESGNTITVDTGVLRFTVNKQAFNIIDEVSLDTNGDGSYATSERIIAAGANAGAIFTGRLAGDIQRSRDRTNLEVTIEESGPMRAVIKVRSLGQFTSREDHDHGFTVRIYAYGGKSYVKVDYQLQNAVKNVRFSAPLYFDELAYSFKPSLSSPTVRMSPIAGDVWQGSIGSGKVLDQISLAKAVVRSGSSNLKTANIGGGQSSYGWADVSDSKRGMAIMIRHMAEMFPNAVEVGSDDTVTVNLWPRWSAQYEGGTKDLYWLQDMQCVVKETLVYFHGADVSNSELEALAANFQYHPVTALPHQVYDATRATFDMDGSVPAVVDARTTGSTRLTYEGDQLTPHSAKYAFGWADFQGDTGRKRSSTTGGWPYSGAYFAASGKPKDFFQQERAALGELNVRPEWIVGYTHDDDFLTVAPSVNPYAGQSWRKFDGHGRPVLAEEHLDGADASPWTPRDNEHGWFYYIDEHYWVSANPWIRDWYEFIGEFRKRTLLRPLGITGGPWWEWDFATRGIGHQLAHSLQAYRITGDKQLYAGLLQYLVRLKDERQNARYGIFGNHEAVFQAGFLARALLSVYEEARAQDPILATRAFNLAWGLLDWNLNYADFSYYIGAGEQGTGHDGTSLTMVDPVVAFYRYTGEKKYLDQLDNYMTGSRPPYGRFDTWTGDWQGRLWNGEKQNPRPAPNPAAKIADLKLSLESGQIKMSWTTPARAKRFMAVYSTKPIAASFTADETRTNFWAGEPIGISVAATPGETQNFTFSNVPAGQKIYVAMVSFTENQDISGISNTASITVP